MHSFLYSTLWIGLLFYLVCNVEGGDAERGKPSGRIKGGNKAGIYEFPWAVTLRAYRYYGEKVQCGGSIIGDKWVLTAAHCLAEKPVWITPGQTTGQSAILRDRYKIYRSYEHPTFSAVYDPPGDRKKGKLVQMRDDIALLELEKGFRKLGSIQKIGLSKTAVQTNQHCRVVGWGDTDGLGNQSPTLKEIDVMIAHTCNNWKNVFPNPSDNICIQPSRNQACGADSGGPLMCKENGRFVLKGVLSVGTNCQLRRGSSVFANVNKYVKWIEQVTKLDFGSGKGNRPGANARMYHKIANAGSGMDTAGNASDTPNLAAISPEKLVDELNDIDGRYKLRTSGLGNHDGSPMSTNSASMPMTTPKMFLFVGVPIFIIGLIVVFVVATVWIRKSSHRKKDTLEMTEPLPDPATQ